MSTTVTTFNKIDIHCHIVPGVDDGATSIEQSLELLHKAKKIGINEIICTSHFSYDNELYNRQFEVVSRVAKGFGIKLYKGSEVMLNSSTVSEIVNNRVVTLNNTKYVLVELKRNNQLSFSEICEYLEELKENGFKVILAHPEQTKKTFNKFEKLVRLKEMGILIQVDASSFYTSFNFKRRVKKLLKFNLISFVASDTHRTTGNYKYLDKFYNYIVKNHGEQLAETIFYTNPKKVIEGKDI